MMPIAKYASRLVALALPALLFAGDAAAQKDDGEQLYDIEVPVVVLEDTTDVGTGGNEEIDLANIVQTAAKGVTTVQEAPAIVTVLTAEEINDRGYTTVTEIADSVPGWLRADQFNIFEIVSTRGAGQGMMYLVNSVQMFDPFYNIPTVGRVAPIETIKRIELITGPGGVLWGANSYLGLLNIITKDADDVDGVEAGVRMGDGPGDRGLFRAYVMAGITDLPADSDLFLHASYETFEGPEKFGVMNFFSSSAPNPVSQRFRGAQLRSNQPRSNVFNLTGKLNVDDKLNVYFGVPFVERYTAQSFTSYVSREDRPSDSLDICDPDTIDPTMIPGQCSDPQRLTRANEINWFDRYAIAEYRTRLVDGKAGITARGYATQFVRDFPSLPVNYGQGSANGTPFEGLGALSAGGTATGFDGTNWRYGLNLDGDIELPGNARILLGGEAFYERYGGGATGDGSIQGQGISAGFVAPPPTSLPIPCPAVPTDSYDPADPTNVANLDYREGCPITHVFGGNDRTVLGAFVNPQWKPMRKLTIDGGIRVQGAPDSLGSTGYDTQTIFSGALVYNFAKNWFFKFNYAEGFRPPVFNSLFSNGEAIQFDGTEDLDTESSRAFQGEVNARLFRGTRRIRELNFRADYSYTTLENLIIVSNGRYINSADRGVHSAEFLGKLYLDGGHRIELAYTWLQVNTEDEGILDNLPNHWFNIGGVFSVIGDTLMASTRMRVIGSFIDPNQMVEYRDYRVDNFSDPASPSFGRVINDRNSQVGCTLLSQAGCLTIQPNELVRDRIPASAELTLG
ncbi:MAG: TonB-dependent receptor, partial [Deltaproteobacteria bacterium]|nr:TonB-dependent receptor [Deltaproteobacteria bacterium]